MRIFPKQILLIVALLMALSLNACGSAANTTAPGTVPTSASQPTLPPSGQILPTRPANVAQPTAAPGPTVKLLATFNGDPDRFKQPWRIAVDATNHIYVIEGAEIRKFDPTTNVWAKWVSQAQVGFAVSIAVDKQGSVYVTYSATSGSTGVQKIDSNGKLLIKWGSLGAGKGQFNGPDDIAVDTQGNVFVMDSSNHRIQKFDSSGKFLTLWGTEGKQDGQFSRMSALAVDPQGNVYVGDSQGAYSRVSKFDNNGKFLLNLDNCGQDLKLVSANAIAADQHNHIYVADGSSGRICTFDEQGNFLGRWNGEAGNSASQLSYPWGLAVDDEGNIYVSDQSSKTVREFQLK